MCLRQPLHITAQTLNEGSADSNRHQRIEPASRRDRLHGKIPSFKRGQHGGLPVFRRRPAPAFDVQVGGWFRGPELARAVSCHLQTAGFASVEPSRVARANVVWLRSCLPGASLLHWLLKRSCLPERRKEPGSPGCGETGWLRRSSERLT